MTRFLTIAFLLVIPMLAVAQAPATPSLLVVNGGSTITPTTPVSPAEAAAPVDTNKMLSQFPTSAVTKVDNTPPVANVPAPSAAAISKLWPRDTVQIFMKSCVKFSKELIQPCNCIITGVMEQLTHEEFMNLSQAGKVESDPRVQAIRSQCATKPKQQQ